MTTLTNQTALVTGASRGIGRATAKALASAGAHVIVHYGRAATEATTVVEEIRAAGGRADAVKADLSTPDGPATLAEQVRAIVGDHLDILVSNAGVSKAATIKDHTLEDFDNLFATNVRGPFFLVQQLLPLLGEGSNIIVISSISDGGGYAFGDTDFYLNIGMIDEFVVAKGTTTHELYHAVQGAFAKERDTVANVPVSMRSQPQQACYADARLFASLYEEGSATYVEDISLLSEARSTIGLRKRNDMTDGLRHIHSSVSLLEMSVVALRADPAVPYDDVYDVGFYGQGVLYNIGYVMAKAIVESDGPQGLAAFLREPPYKFVLHYTQLPEYATDEDHPGLGPNTMAAVNQFVSGCK
jgi:NAD(P)-dependent dehydrogenase (short-subunit alcohol dehydrogenase family)